MSTNLSVEPIPIPVVVLVYVVVLTHAPVEISSPRVNCYHGTCRDVLQAISNRAGVRVCVNNIKI